MDFGGVCREVVYVKKPLEALKYIIEKARL
jgi:hypothetical protein